MTAWPHVLFLDLEIEEASSTKAKRLLEIGACLDAREYHGASGAELVQFSQGAKVICGHNLVLHDAAYLKSEGRFAAMQHLPAMDTLILSVLLQPDEKRHKLDKEYKLALDQRNDPLADAKACRDLLGVLVSCWNGMSYDKQRMLHALLGQREGVAPFFDLVGFATVPPPREALVAKIRHLYAGKICDRVELDAMVTEGALELAFALQILDSHRPNLITPSWLLFTFPLVQRVYRRLRTRSCTRPDCSYCADMLDPVVNLKRFFGYEGFRRFQGDGEMPLQEQAVRAALRDESLITVFPTGGGKSITFQLPALMRGRANNSLTVVISPLVSLMKDQVDGLKRKDNSNVAAINGLLSPLERMEVVEEVENGKINLLYLAPESLRSSTIHKLLRQRIIDRFVIDEAHCFSAWGQDFRVEYLYIAEFIKELNTSTNRPKDIPVSCFTATARKEVLDDIQKYFKVGLNLDLKMYATLQGRENLSYRVIECQGDEGKMPHLVSLLQDNECPSIVYVSRVKTAERVGKDLSARGINAGFFHGKMQADDKKQVMDDFMKGDTRVIVATSAFGMGVDKDNVGLVVHYEISNSLENYLQEAGRAGRDPKRKADCVVLYDEADLDKHFELLTGTKLNQGEINQVWKAIKDFKSNRISKSALEIAKQAGWDEDMRDLETRVKTALNALEEAKYIQRGLNSHRIFSNSIEPKTLEQAKGFVTKHHEEFSARQLELSDRALQYLYRPDTDIALDYMADRTGIEQHDLVTLLNLFKQIRILGDSQDISAVVESNKRKAGRAKLRTMLTLEKSLQELLLSPKGPIEHRINLREINSSLHQAETVGIPELRAVLQDWHRMDFLKVERSGSEDFWYHLHVGSKYPEMVAYLEDRRQLAGWVMESLEKIPKDAAAVRGNPDATWFSVLGLKAKLETENAFAGQRPIKEYEQALLYLNHIGAIELRDGLLVRYSRLAIERLNTDKGIKYKKEDYAMLEKHYAQKVEQVHVVGEYVKRLLEAQKKAVDFTQDYFSLDNKTFYNRYFPNGKAAIQRSITETKFKAIFGTLSPEQLEIVNDQESEKLVVAAGPGSGKTMVLVHKMASLLLLEGVKPEEFLMLAFSRPAAMEFRSRLRALVPGLGGHVDIQTYHGLAFRLLGKLGDLEDSKNVMQRATEAIRNDEIPMEMAARKTVIMLDEFQDVSAAEWGFFQVLAEKANNPRIMVAGDDDQCIYEFRGADSEHMHSLIREGGKPYFLTKNYRSVPLLVEFANEMLGTMAKGRVKAGQFLRSGRQNEAGQLRIVRYGHGDLLQPLVAAIAARTPAGTCAVLCSTNEEAAQIRALLRQRGIAAMLLNDRNGFSAGKLRELAFATEELKRNPKENPIPPQAWVDIEGKLKHKFARSSDLGLALHAIESFRNDGGKKYLIDWQEFLTQLRVEDLCFPEQQKVFVSTMHKAKGKEFDAVYLLLQGVDLEREERKKVLYVAITRAKTFLEIHTPLPFFDGFALAGMERLQGQAERHSPDYLEIECGLNDIVLDGFLRVSVITEVAALQAGDELKLANSGAHLVGKQGRFLLRFSKRMLDQLAAQERKGFQVVSCIVDHVVGWKKEPKDGKESEEVMVVLPRLGLRRKRNN